MDLLWFCASVEKEMALFAGSALVGCLAVEEGAQLFVGAKGHGPLSPNSPTYH